MKKVLTCIVLLVIVSSANAQWQWATADLNHDTGTASVPWGVATDTAGNIFVAGGYRGTTTIGTTLLNAGFNRPWSAFCIAKYNATGNVLWAKTSVTKPNTSWCFAYSVATDKAGNAYATGMFFDSMSFGAYTISSAAPNVFLVKYDGNGNVLWVRTSTGSTNATGNYVAVDASGNPYITGQFYNSISFGAQTLTNGGSSGNAFITKYDANGNALWARSPTGSTYSINGTGLAADNVGNIYATGNYNTNTSISFGTFALANGNTRNMYLVKYDGNGNALWATNALIASSTSAISNTPALGEYLTTDNAGNVYVTGNYIDTVQFGTQLLTDGLVSVSGAAYSGNVFVAKYSSAGKPVWAKSGLIPNRSAFAVDYSITADQWNNIYVSGAYYGGFTFGGINLTAPSTGEPAFIIKLDSAGNALCGTSVNDQKVGHIYVDVSGANGLAVDPKGPNVFFTGGVQSYPSCVLYPDTITGTGDEYGFVGKWTCGTCNIAPLITGNTAVCNGQQISLVAGGGTGYVWSNGNTTDSITIHPSSSGTYYVAITNDSCTRKDSVAVTVYPVPVAGVSNAQTICEGNTATLSASGGTTYLWQPGAGLSSSVTATPNAIPVVTTTYTVTISNSNCSVTDSTIVFVNPLPIVSACCDTTISPGQHVQLTSSGGGNYAWIPSYGINCTTCNNPNASPLVTTTYTLTVTSDSGCSVSQTITIVVSCGTIFIPDAFSPNNDGQNDYLYVRGDCIKTMQFEIFDRWGNKVFETTDQNIPWNGLFNGKAANTGSYVYYLSATLYDGTTQTKKGSVALVR
jgi:gliding motility-associated-like protein